MSVIEIAPIAAGPHIDPRKYSRLIAQFAPKVIESSPEHKRATQDLLYLMQKQDRTAEELAATKLLATLIQQYESTAFPIAESTPREMLEFVMEQHNLKAIDLAELLGGRPRVSEILSGKREISKAQAKSLGLRFNVSPSVFI